MMEKTISVSTDIPNAIDFTTPIKLLIKKKSQIDSQLLKQQNDTVRDDQLRSCLKMRRFTKDMICLNLNSQNNSEIGQGKKKVSFRNMVIHKKPIADVYKVPSFKNENKKNNFCPISNRSDKNENTVCNCLIL